MANIIPAFPKHAGASINMTMRPCCPDPDGHPLLGVTANELAEVSGSVQKARILMQERPEMSFAQALHRALWDHVEAVH